LVLFAGRVHAAMQREHAYAQTVRNSHSLVPSRHLIVRRKLSALISREGEVADADRIGRVTVTFSSSVAATGARAGASTLSVCGLNAAGHSAFAMS